MSLFHAAIQPALDSDGSPISGATWNFYITGTLTPRNVYSSSSLATSLGSTVTANAAGRFANIFFDDTFVYRAILKDAGGGTIKDIDPANSGATATNAGPFRIGTSSDAASDNSVIIAGNNYTDVTGLTDSIHTFCTVGTASITATGQSGNDYDTARIYNGTGTWGHHNHFQTGTVFGGSVQFTDVVGLAGTITVQDSASIGNYYYVDFLEPVPTGSGVVGRNVMLRYTTSHFASNMTNITSATQNYALEVRKFLLDPATAYAASIMSEGQATFKSISASDSEVSPYNTDGTLNANLERMNVRSAAGQNGYIKFQNTGNAWLVGQLADGIDFRIRTTSGAAGGIDIANAGHVTPSADNSADLGTAALSWRGVYADTGFYHTGVKVVGAQGAAVADATDAASAITQLNALLARCRAHGLIAT